ncbi:hypothetical protein IJT17_09965 [bacterium]|nr:hypothetical protein [bacterium]
MDLDYTDLKERINSGDPTALEAALDEFKNGERGAYNLLIELLKRSEPYTEKALRQLLASDDTEEAGLASELVTQAYYPFVEALCKYKFKGKPSQEITDITAQILSVFADGASRLPRDTAIKNYLYQCVCRQYRKSGYSWSPSASKGADSQKQEEAASGRALASAKAANTESAANLENRISDLIRNSSGAKNNVDPVLAQTAAKAVVDAVSKQVSGGSKSVLPVIEADKKQPVIKVKGLQADSNEAKATSPDSIKLIEALERMSERDFNRYMLIVTHYFGRKGYSKLCEDFKLTSDPRTNLYAVGKSLCEGMLQLGRELFGG